MHVIVHPSFYYGVVHTKFKSDKNMRKCLLMKLMLLCLLFVVMPTEEVRKTVESWKIRVKISCNNYYIEVTFRCTLSYGTGLTIAFVRFTIWPD